jgi:hypothetical protein
MNEHKCGITGPGLLIRDIHAFVFNIRILFSRGIAGQKAAAMQQIKRYFMLKNTSKDMPEQNGGEGYKKMGDSRTIPTIRKANR